MLPHFPKAYFLSFLCVLVLFSACDDDDNMEPAPTPDYIIPSSYSFDNVSYTGQTARLGMFAEMKNYISISRNLGTSLELPMLQAMFANDAANASWTQDYGTKQMRDKTFEPVQEDFDDLIIELVTASESTQPGSLGVSGVIESTDGAKSYLIGDDGLDHAQVFEKGLMGALLYYQATSVYFGADRMNVDNTIITDGEGTEMEHHWDEAFGYFGVPKFFPVDLDGISFWGNYSNNRNTILMSNETIMDAFIKGRAAISNDDLTSRDEAIAEAREGLELVAVGSALHYLNSGISNFEDKAIALHGLSEAIGFIYALKFNEARKITLDQIDALLIEMAGSADFSSMNLYTSSIEKLQSVKDDLAGFYDLNDLKDLF